MNEDDVLRKVQGLMRLAADPSTSEHERSAATQKAVALRLKHGISDKDLAVLDDDDEFVFMGHRMFFFSRHIQPHLDRIKAEIDRALAKADALDPQNRASTYAKLYKALHELVEGSYRGQLKARRDEAVKALYQAVAEQYATDHGVDYDVSELRQHEWARDRTASACDMRKDAVERIVGTNSKAIWAKVMRSQVCERCGLDGNEGRQTCDVYEVEGHQPGDVRVWRHPDCHTAAKETTDAR